MTSNILNATAKILEVAKPDFVVVQGDTTTTFASSLASYYQKIPVIHIEAGLRTNDIYSPFPEEANRKFVSQIAKFHFAPTQMTYENLLKEGIHENVFVTGNTSIDALRMASLIIKDANLNLEFVEKNKFLDPDKKLVLVTTHRRENHGEPLLNILNSIKDLALERKDIQFVLPVHLNPNVKVMVDDILANLDNVTLLAPLNYPEFVWFMEKSYIILTDSGGVQEEGPYFKKPILVLRENTERPEGVVFKTTKLVGADRNLITLEISRLIDDKKYYAEFQNATTLMGMDLQQLKY
jgi:UDP-N-acetylglucosamine 2-epimerase (non-hydrolysing)